MPSDEDFVPVVPLVCVPLVWPVDPDVVPVPEEVVCVDPELVSDVLGVAVEEVVVVVPLVLVAPPVPEVVADGGGVSCAKTIGE